MDGDGEPGSREITGRDEINAQCQKEALLGPSEKESGWGVNEKRVFTRGRRGSGKDSREIEGGEKTIRVMKEAENTESRNKGSKSSPEEGPEARGEKEKARNQKKKVEEGVFNSRRGSKGWSKVMKKGRKHFRQKREKKRGTEASGGP